MNETVKKMCPNPDIPAIAGLDSMPFIVMIPFVICIDTVSNKPI